MPSGLRRVELIEAGADASAADIQHASHVVGVDESGNSRGEPLVMAAVQCPRTEGEDLANALIELGLEPWKSKSSSSPAGVDNEELSARVETLIQRIEDSPATWYAVGGWGRYNKAQRGAIASIVSSKAMTGGSNGEMPEFEGPAAIIHDGGRGLYGNQQLPFRRYASRQFSGYSDRVTPVYLSFLQEGDKTYPEITAADYIAGYLKTEIEERGIEGTSPLVQRIDNSWRASDESPMALYRLRNRERIRSSRKENRIASWIDGRRAPLNGSTWGEAPLEALVDRLHSQTVRDYILNEV